MGKRILVIARSSSIAGAEIVTLDVLGGFLENGNAVHCIVSGWSNEDFLSRLKKIGIAYTPLKLGWYYLRKLAWSFDSLMHYPGAVIRYIKIQRSFKPDIIYLSLFRHIILLYPFLKRNVVYHVHDPNYFSRQSRIFLKKADRKVVKYIAVSDFIKKDLMQCGIAPGKIEVVHNGVDIDPLTAEVELYGSGLTLGIIGQVISRKGHRDVIEALHILTQKGINNVTLKIVGIGDKLYVQELIQLIAEYKLGEKVYWEGFKKSRSEIYAGIDIVIVPTRNDEPFALVPLEANALGKMVIVTNTGGFPEMVTDGYNGFVIDSCSPKMIAEKIEQVLANDELRVNMGRNGISLVAQYFTKKTMLNKINELIENL
jgi:glycosyltransferase involved in cell wall biosynthesis